MDTWANLSCQSVLYGFLLPLNGAELRQTLATLGAATIVNLVGGRPYGLVLEGFRYLLNVDPG